jgi:acetyl-CoA carboxylase carboxyl transferase subunit beta
MAVSDKYDEAKGKKPQKPAKAPKPARAAPAAETEAVNPAVKPVSSKPGGERRERGGWLAKIAPGVRKAFAKRDTPENLWVKCPDTGEMIYRPDLEAALWVTPAGRHMRIGSDLRFRYTFDDATWETIDTPDAPEDPLEFFDGRPYRERLDTARKTTGAKDAMAIGYGKIHNQPAVAIVQDFAFMGGSLGVAAGEAFICAAQQAVKRNAPLVMFTASGGARMQEGTLSLMQLARTTLAIQELKKAQLPYVVVLTDPTTGGVTASYAMLGDVHLAEPGALIGFAGQRVIEQTIRETLPAGFQRSEYLVEKGMVDRVVLRHEIPHVLGAILSMLMSGKRRAA